MDIFVGNFPFNTTEDDLSQAFAAHGTVERVHLVMDRETGRPRGFGFVTMPDAQEAKAAIEALEGTDFNGRELRCNEARPREERPRRPSGGGGERRGGGGGGGRRHSGGGNDGGGDFRNKDDWGGGGGERKRGNDHRQRRRSNDDYGDSY